MHRRKDFFGNAASFRPLRWKEGNEGGPDLKKVVYGYLPFNGGPRIYTGRKSIQARVFSVHLLTVAEEFGLLEASYTVARLLHSFRRIEKSKGRQDFDKHSVTLVLAPANRCKVILTP